MNMALKGNTAQERAWNFFMSKGVGEYGTAGIMASIRAESAFNPCNLQNSYNKKLNISDEDYTRLVDGNNYPGFVTDKAGYGYAQWTYYTRKQNLLNYAKQQGKSIGDEEMQLNFIWVELSGAYKGVLSKLKSAKSTREASDIVLTGYEKPNNQGLSAKEERGGYAEEYYKQFAMSKGGNTMSVIVGSARINEKGTTTGGAAGDQTKGEVSTQAWYLHSKGWIVIRAKDKAIAEKIAQNMQAICDNDNIGYCQSHRGSLTTAAKPFGYDASKVTTKVEVDCSEAVRNCVLYAGINVASFTTANEKTMLNATGKFDILTTDQYCKSSDYLQRGDILVTKTKGHTVVALSNGAKVSNSTTQSTSSTPAVKVEAAKSKSASLAGSYKTTANLNLRAGAGKSKTSITIIPKGETVKCYGYYTDVSGTKWLLVAYKGMTGFCSSAYLKKA
jgi:hypothetical protein